MSMGRVLDELRFFGQNTPFQKRLLRKLAAKFRQNRAVTGSIGGFAAAILSRLPFTGHNPTQRAAGPMIPAIGQPAFQLSKSGRSVGAGVYYLEVEGGNPQLFLAGQALEPPQ